MTSLHAAFENMVIYMTMAGKGDEDSGTNEQVFSIKETAIVLQAASLPWSYESAELKEHAQAILLEKAKDNGVEIDPNRIDNDLPSALLEIRYVISFAYEHQIDAEGYLCDMLAKPHTKVGKDVITQIISIYQQANASVLPQSSFRLTMSEWMSSHGSIPSLSAKRQYIQYQ